MQIVHLFLDLVWSQTHTIFLFCSYSINSFRVCYITSAALFGCYGWRGCLSTFAFATYFLNRPAETH
jgi:hypothetical protein